MNELLWTLPLVGALVGWATNWLAVRMLFRPREPRHFMGITFVGLIPRRRKEMASRIAATVEKELVRAEDITKLLDDPELADAAKEEIDRRVREFLAMKFKEIPAIAKAMLPSDLEERLRKSIVKHVMAALPEISTRIADELGNRLDVKELVETRINGFDMATLERMILDIASRELRRIELLGGLIGAVVGGVQWAVLYFVPELLK